MSRNKKNALMVIYLFFLIYLPDFSYLFVLFKPSIIITILAVFNIYYLHNEIIIIFKNNQKIKNLFAITIIMLFYLIDVQLLSEGLYIKDLFPNLLLIVQIINYLSLIIWYEKINKEINFNRILKLMLLVGAIQAAMTYLMLFIPSFRQIAINLFGGSDGIPPSLQYLVLHRIYGIGSSYTFMLPLIQGLLSTLAIYVGINRRNPKYIIMALFILGSSILNGRTGMLLFLIFTAIYLGFFFYKEFKWKYISYLGIAGLLFVIMLFIMSKTNEDQYKWLTDSFIEIYLLVFRGESVGTFSLLAGEHIVMPKTFTHNLFGTGYSIILPYGHELFDTNSDIGYINDWFKGGFIYLGLMYYSMIRVIRKTSTSSILNATLLAYALLANYKGPILIGSPIAMILLTFGVVTALDASFLESDVKKLY